MKKKQLPKYEGKSEPQVKKKKTFTTALSPLPNPPPTTLTNLQPLQSALWDSTSKKVKSL